MSDSNQWTSSFYLKLLKKTSGMRNTNSIFFHVRIKWHILLFFKEFKIKNKIVSKIMLRYIESGMYKILHSLTIIEKRQSTDKKELRNSA